MSEKTFMQELAEHGLIQAAFELLGFSFEGKRPNEKGWVPNLRLPPSIANDKNPSVSVNLHTGACHDFGSPLKGDLVTLVEKQRACSPAEAIRWLREALGLKGSSAFKPLTVAALARRKQLPPEWLAELGCSDRSDGVHIPYFTRDQAPCRAQVRGRLGGGWRWDARGDAATLPIRAYGLWLPLNQSAKHLTLVEGCSDAWTFWHNDEAALGIPGAEMAHVLEAEDIAAAEKLYIVQEADQGGERFVRGVAQRLQALGYDTEYARVIDGSRLQGGDPSAHFMAVGDAFPADWQAQCTAARPLDEVIAELSVADSAPREPVSEPSTNSREQPVDTLITCANEADLFMGTDHVMYATLPSGKTVALQAPLFREWLIAMYLGRSTGGRVRLPSERALEDALRTLEARAKYLNPDTPRRPVHLRVAGEEDEAGQLKRIYIDLANEQNEIVVMSADGVQICSSAESLPVRFLRKSVQRPLPRPDLTGSLDALLPFLRFESKEEQFAVIAWLLYSLVPRGPYPILAIQGPAGSGKSTLSRYIRDFIDPSQVPLRRPERSSEDRFLHARNNWMVAYENVSALSHVQSDDLASISTGAGYATRRHYTNTEEVAYAVRRPIMLNGIGHYIERPDLASRALIVRARPLGPQSRKTESSLDAAFRAARPYIFGALCNTLVQVLRHSHEEAPIVTRMADFCNVIYRARRVLPFRDLDPIQVLVDAEQQWGGDYLERNPLLVGLQRLVEGHGEITSDMTTLQQQCAEAAGLEEMPMSPRGFSALLEHAMPVLNSFGIYREALGRVGPLRRPVYRYYQTSSDEHEGEVEPASE
ncbi:MAG: hypothetical protein RhofKO_17310 [Rhodothermales bacterium]